MSFNLDPNGNIIETLDSSIGPGTIYSYTYDNINRVDTFTNHLVNKTLDYDYDHFGNRDKLTIKEGAILLHTIDYSYNKFEQLKSIDGPGGPTTLYYWPTGSMKTKIFPNGVTGNYTYWDDGNLKILTYSRRIGEGQTLNSKFIL